jgi:Domain of unknown function DUF29
MTQRSTGDEAELVPADAPAGASYERDFYTWTQEQGRLLRQGAWAQIDRDNVAEEIETLGRSEFDKLESALRVLLLHLLKWDHQPQLRSRSWVLSIKEQRARVRYVLADNPGLKPRLDEAIARAYEAACIGAAKETGLEEDAFPPACPYDFEQITRRVVSI